MSLEHGTLAPKLYEEEAYKHLFADADVIYSEDKRYRWDQRRGTIDGRAVYFAPSSVATQSGETLVSKTTSKQQRGVVKAEGLGIIPDRFFRMTRERITMGAAAVAAVFAGVGAAYMTDSIPYVDAPHYANDAPSNEVDTVDEEPSTSKKKADPRPENPFPTYQPVAVYEDYSSSPRPSSSPEATPSPSENNESPTPKPTPTQSETGSVTPLPSPSETPPVKTTPPVSETPSPPSPSVTESSPVVPPEMSSSPSTEEVSPQVTASSPVQE